MSALIILTVIHVFNSADLWLLAPGENMLPFPMVKNMCDCIEINFSPVKFCGGVGAQYNYKFFLSDSNFPKPNILLKSPVVAAH